LCASTKQSGSSAERSEILEKLAFARISKQRSELASDISSQITRARLERRSKGACLFFKQAEEALADISLPL